MTGSYDYEVIKVKLEQETFCYTWLIINVNMIKINELLWQNKKSCVLSLIPSSEQIEGSWVMCYFYKYKTTIM